MEAEGTIMKRREAECLEAELSAAEDREMEQSGKFEAMRSEGEDIELVLAPPDLWNRSQESGRSRAQLFSEAGLVLTRSSRDFAAGCAAMKEWLAAGPGWKVTSPATSGGLMVRRKAAYPTTTMRESTTSRI